MEYGLGYIIIRSPNTTYSIYLRETIGAKGMTLGSKAPCVKRLPGDGLALDLEALIRLCFRHSWGVGFRVSGFQVLSSAKWTMKAHSFCPTLNPEL